MYRNLKEIMVDRNVYFTDLYCIYLADLQAAVISDLHLGFEEEMNMNGLFLPKLQRDHVEGIVQTIVDRYSPEKVIINGDFKQEFRRNLSQEWDDVIHFIDRFAGEAELIFVRGNHDNYLQTILSRRNITQIDYYEDDNYFIYHGEKDMGLKKTTILGHEHPSLVLRDRVGGIYKVPAFVYNRESKIAITPAMSIFSSGTDITQSLLSDEHFTPVLKKVNTRDFRVFGITDDFGLVDFGFLSDLHDRAQNHQH
ncbi:MAG: metallophosphoesterase [Candidatus Thermoplasmatota archaeon]|jgi:hypothetical protein|nr:metallophosphoesterase [Candidatus Thermoplasmatota archaeon]